MPDPIEILNLNPLHRLIGELHKLAKSRLWLQVLVGMFTSIVFGTLIGPSASYVRPETSRIIAEWAALSSLVHHPRPLPQALKQLQDGV